MHILILVVLVVIFVAVYFGLFVNKPTDLNSPATDNSPNNRTTGGPQRPICFISQGKLYYKNGSGPIQQIHSEYVQNVMDKMELSKQRHGWKEDTSWGTSFVGQGQRKEDADKVAIQFTSAVFKDSHTLLYFLSDNYFGGLFQYDIETGKELRLLHKQNLIYRDLHYCPHRCKILASSQYQNGVANIIELSEDGSSARELTGGDTVDTAPAWITADKNQIVFQSQGLARSAEGYVIAYGPAAIELLDLNDGELQTVKENSATDFLQPRVAANGDLYFIERPYEAVKYGAGQAFTDVLFFPFRLLRALFHYLNFFSLMYSRKPLTSASGPRMQGDLKQIMLRGKRIDAERALKKEKPVNGVPSLVPATWRLMARSGIGSEHVVATHVSSFVFDGDSQAIYTNGCGVFSVNEQHHPTYLFQQELIEEVIVANG